MNGDDASKILFFGSAHAVCHVHGVQHVNVTVCLGTNIYGTLFYTRVCAGPVSVCASI